MTKPRKKILLALDKALSESLIKQIAILIVLLAFTLALSFILLSFSGSDWKAFCDEKQLHWWLLPLYLLIDPNALNNLYINTGIHGWMLLASTIVYILGTVVFTGMIIGVINNAISNRVENHRNGYTHYLLSDHYLIMGYDEMVPSIIQDIFSKDKSAFVLLLTAYDVQKVKEWLNKSVAKAQLDQVIVNFGHRTASEYYPEIHLEASKEIFIVGYRTNPSHDAVNIECIDSICSYLKKHKTEQLPKRITCVFEDLDTYAAFKTTEIFKEVGELGIEFVPYNFYAGWARQVFVTRSYKEKSDPTNAISYPCVYGNGIGPDDKKHVHLVFVGTSNLAVSFAMEAAHLLHFPNFDEKHRKPKTRITFIDQNMDKEMPLFITRNRHFFDVQNYLYEDISLEPKAISKQPYKDNFLDVEFEFIRGDIYSKAVQDKIKGWASDVDGQYLSIFLAMADQRNNFMMGMNMPDEVYDKEIPVFIRQDRADNFVTNLRNSDIKKSQEKELKHLQVADGKLESKEYKGRYANIYPFGMNDMAYCRDEVAYKRAKLINYLYCKTQDNHFPDTLVLAAMSTGRLLKAAEAEWNELSVADKWSNLYCAYHIPYKLASLRVMRGLDPNDTSHDQQTLTEEEIHTMAAVEHNRWNVEKLLMGFRRPKENEDKYEHPEFKDKLKDNKKIFIHHDIRPFDTLDDIQQMDFEIVKYIPWILKMTEA